MFKNRFFRGNTQWNRRMIKNLNELSKQSQRMLEMEKRIQQMEAKIKGLKDQTITDDGSQTSSTSKAISAEIDWKHNVSIQHLRFYSFLQSTVGAFHLNTQDIYYQLEAPKFSMEFIPRQQRSLYLQQAHQIIKESLQSNSQFFRDLEGKKMSKRLKIFFIFRKIQENLKATIQINSKLLKVCHEIIFEMFRQQLIKNSQEKSSKKFSIHQRMGRKATQKSLCINTCKQNGGQSNQID